MNPGPSLIIRTTFYLLLLVFTIFALINFESTKISFLLATINKNPKNLYLLVLVYFKVVVYFIAFLLLLFALLI